MMTLDEMVLKCEARIKENVENKHYFDAAIFATIRQELQKMDDEQTIEVTDARAQELADKALALAKVRLGDVLANWKIAV